MTHLSTIDLPPFVDPEILEIFFEGKKPDGKCPTGNPQIRNLTYVVGGWTTNPTWKNMRKSKLDHETPGIGVNIWTIWVEIQAVVTNFEGGFGVICFDHFCSRFFLLFGQELCVFLKLPKNTVVSYGSTVFSYQLAYQEFLLAYLQLQKFSFWNFQLAENQRISRHWWFGDPGVPCYTQGSKSLGRCRSWFLGWKPFVLPFLVIHNTTPV